MFDVKPLHEIVGVVIILGALAFMGIGVGLGLFERYKKTDVGFAMISAATVLIAVGLWVGAGWKLGLFGLVGLVGVWLPLYRRYFWK